MEGYSGGPKREKGGDPDWMGGAKARHHFLKVISEIKCVLG